MFQSLQNSIACKILVRFFLRRLVLAKYAELTGLKYPASLHPVYFELKLNSPNKLTVRMIITFHCSWVHAKLSDGVYLEYLEYIFFESFGQISSLSKDFVAFVWGMGISWKYWNLSKRLSKVLNIYMVDLGFEKSCFECC